MKAGDLQDHEGLAYRPDIDGLRAVAVLIVVAFHAAPGRLPGGFVGVDVFFVISGFLINGIILRALAEGRFSLAGFYARRMRRILPALLLVLAAVWIAGWITLLPEDFAGLGSYIAASGAFAANFLTYAQIGYFDVPASTKPLLHLWSLGVEEQFYVVMPLALMAASRWPRSIPWLLGVTALLSFGVNVALIGRDQAAAFYLPVTRFWEIMVGGGLAYVALHRPHALARMHHEAVAAAGLLLIAAAAVFTPASQFPGWWATLPVSGAALLIAAGPRTLINGTILSWRPVVAAGLISYPLYLWHWPVMVFFRTETALTGRAFVLITIAIAVVLATATYGLIERPVRRLRLSRTALASGALTIAATIAGIVTVASDGLPGRYDPPLPEIFLTTPRPEFFPAGTDAGNVAGPKVLLWGDSNADHLNPGFVTLREERPFRLYHQNWGCPPMRSERPPGRDREYCEQTNTSVEAAITALAPDIAVIASHWPQYDRLDALAEPLALLQRIGTKRIIVVGTVPTWPKTLRRMLLEGWLASKTRQLPERLDTYVRYPAAIEDTLRRVAAAHGALYISPMQALCNAQGCLARLGTRQGDLMEFDQDHFTAEGSRYFVRRIAPEVFGTGD